MCDNPNSKFRHLSANHNTYKYLLKLLSKTWNFNVARAKLEISALKFEIRSLSTSALVYVAISGVSWNKGDRKWERQVFAQGSHLNIASRSWCPYTQITSQKQGGFDSNHGKPHSPFLMSIIFLAPGSCGISVSKSHVVATKTYSTSFYK